jgi:hypothetical protein
METFFLRILITYLSPLSSSVVLNRYVVDLSLALLNCIEPLLLVASIRKIRIMVSTASLRGKW